MVWLRSFILVQKIIALGISGKDIRINYQNKKSSFYWLRLAIRMADIRKLWNLYKENPEARTRITKKQSELEDNYCIRVFAIKIV